eukprot:248060_1
MYSNWIASLTIFFALAAGVYSFGPTQVYLLYETKADCTTAFDAIAINGDCYITNNCSYSGITAKMNTNAVCTITTFGSGLNEVSSQGFGKSTFYFDTPINANASFVRVQSSGLHVEMVADDEFQAYYASGFTSIALPYVTGLINVSVQD